MKREQWLLRLAVKNQARQQASQDTVRAADEFIAAVDAAKSDPEADLRSDNRVALALGIPRQQLSEIRKRVEARKSRATSDEGAV